MDNVELAQENLEHAHHHHPHAEEPPAAWSRKAAITVSILAAIAVMVEMGAQDTMTNYLASDVEASDIWAQYQAKSIRRVVLTEAADIMELAAGATPTPAAQQRIAAARAEAARMRSEPGKDGMQQLATRAHGREEGREHALHLHERLERSARGLQIGIVLAGLSIVTGAFWLLVGGGLLGLAATVYAILTGFSII